VVIKNGVLLAHRVRRTDDVTASMAAHRAAARAVQSRGALLPSLD
jgi:hypothetical protein